MKNIFLYIILLGSLSGFMPSCTSKTTEEPAVSAAREVIQRQIGNRVSEIRFKLLKAQDGHDVYSVQAEDGKLVLGGSTSVALCNAYRIYLREACHLQKTWSGEIGRAHV